MIASMHSLVNEIPVDKVFLIEAADGETLEAPLTKGHELWNGRTAAENVLESQLQAVLWRVRTRCFLANQRHDANLDRSSD